MCNQSFFSSSQKNIYKRRWTAFNIFYLMPWMLSLPITDLLHQVSLSLSASVFFFEADNVDGLTTNQINDWRLILSIKRPLRFSLTSHPHVNGIHSNNIWCTLVLHHFINLFLFPVSKNSGFILTRKKNLASQQVVIMKMPCFDSQKCE